VAQKVCGRKRQFSRPSFRESDAVKNEVRDVINGDRRLAVREVADKCGISKTTAHQILGNYLNMNRVCARWVPRILTAEHLTKKVELSKQFIKKVNYFLKKIKIIDDANCNFCQKENETIEHIFWGCENVQNLLGQVNSWSGDKDINQTFFKKTLIFGDVDKVYKDDVYTAILLNIKYYIYTNRCLKKKLSFLSLKACLINLHKTEKMIAVRNQRIAEFQLHWSTFEKLFEDC
jgi:hypothetical protein